MPVVSAGNTGALMALSRYVLKTLPGIDRPAMVSPIPTERGHCYLLDLGANVDCSAEHLYQFAIMGAVAAETLGVPRPRVALLNVGTEDIKGNQQVKLAANMLQQAHGLNFIGYIEGDGMYRGEADVVVCDGFVGNILLKSSEGLAKMITGRVETLFSDGLFAQAIGALAMPLLRRLKADLAPARHNGASFLGLQGIVVKSHGAAGRRVFRVPFAARCAKCRKICRSDCMVALRICCCKLVTFSGRWLRRNVTAARCLSSNCQFAAPGSPGAGFSTQGTYSCLHPSHSSSPVRVRKPWPCSPITAPSRSWCSIRLAKLPKRSVTTSGR
jgi:hypothetical protein